MSATVEEGTINGVEYEIFDFTALVTPGFIPGFYYSAGETGEEFNLGVDEFESVVLEGPYATREEAHQAVTDFITLADQSDDDEFDHDAANARDSFEAYLDDK